MSGRECVSDQVLNIVNKTIAYETYSTFSMSTRHITLDRSSHTVGLKMNKLRGGCLAMGIVGTSLILSGCGSAPPVASSPLPTAPQVEQPKAMAPSTPPAESVIPAPAPAMPPAISTPSIPAPPPATPPPSVVSPPSLPPSSAPPKAPAAMKKPADPNTFVINAVTKDQSHPFYGQGHPFGFTVNGEQGKPLVLTRGETYNFEVDTGVQHDFYFSTSPVGWGGGVFADGVKGQFTYQGTVSFKPTTTAPDQLYYQCRNHKNMGGVLHIIEKGQAFKLDSKAAAKNASKSTLPPAPAALKLTPQQVQQKLAYAEMLLGSSDSAKRIQSSNNAEAKDLQKQAQEQVSKAKAAGPDLPKAMAAVDEAFRLNGLAVKLVPSGSTPVDYKAEYEHVHKEMKGYEQSYNKNRKAKDSKVTAKLDDVKYKSLVAQAEQAAAKGDYAAAIKPIKEAANMITAAISVMLDDSTVVYELKFDTPKDEYEYELERYKSYAELVPIAKQELNVNAAQSGMVDELVQKAEQIIDQGKALAAKGDFTTAIQAAQGATENIKRALVGIGVK